MDTSTTTATEKPTRTTNILDALRSQLRGALCYPGEPGYEEARTIWNAMIDKRPAAVIRAAGTADVMRAVNVAREHEAPALRPRRRPQHRRERRLRRRPHGRPLPDEVGARRSVAAGPPASSPA